MNSVDLRHQPEDKQATIPDADTAMLVWSDGEPRVLVGSDLIPNAKSGLAYHDREHSVEEAYREQPRHDMATNTAELTVKGALRATLGMCTVLAAVREGVGDEATKAEEKLRREALTLGNLGLVAADAEREQQLQSRQLLDTELEDAAIGVEIELGKLSQPDTGSELEV